MAAGTVLVISTCPSTNGVSINNKAATRHDLQSGRGNCEVSLSSSDKAVRKVASWDASRSGLRSSYTRRLQDNSSTGKMSNLRSGESSQYPPRLPETLRLECYPYWSPVFEESYETLLNQLQFVLALIEDPFVHGTTPWTLVPEDW
jgi:hypothetical protein